MQTGKIDSHSNPAAGSASPHTAHARLVRAAKNPCKPKPAPALRPPSRRANFGSESTASTAGTSRHAEDHQHQQSSGLELDRRTFGLAAASAAVLCSQPAASLQPACSQPAEAASSAEDTSHASEGSQVGPEGILERLTAPDYTASGPLSSSAFPNLEHTCSRCFPACLGNRCMLRLGVIFPRDGKSKGTFLIMLKGCMLACVCVYATSSV